MKHILYNLVIEVTRKCNMGCAHCLRGNAQNMDIDLSYIDKILEDVYSIGSITFSGGEPSLNLGAIEYTLELCKKKGIEVGSFYIVTNGKDNILPLSISALKWYAYCWEKELCGLALSKDMFHDEIEPENERLLHGLSFFVDDKFTDFETGRLINSGRAEELSGFSKVDVDSHNEKIDVDDWNDERTVNSIIYLAANGDIRTNCDTAYDDYEYVIGSLQDSTLADIIAANIEYEEERVAI